MMHDPLVDGLRDRLIAEYHCHTIILYGSQARGDADSDSDYDVIGFCDGEAGTRRVTGRWRGVLLDVFIYPTTRLSKPDEDMLHVRGGHVLCERESLGTQFLAGIERLYATPPTPLSDDEVEARKNWAVKMIDRLARGDVEGNYRRAWLLTALLENYFLIRGCRYPGPKEAFKSLAVSDSDAFALFEKALAPGAERSDILALVARVNTCER
jgi:predicted nucleotidyltransferase